MAIKNRFTDTGQSVFFTTTAQTLLAVLECLTEPCRAVNLLLPQRNRAWQR